MGFVDVENVLHFQTLQAGDLFIFPKGVVHYQYNNGQGSAFAISAFGSANVGTITTPRSVFLTNTLRMILLPSLSGLMYQ